MIFDGDVVWGSGHRRHKLGPVDAKLDDTIYAHLMAKRPQWVISGMADGYDIRLAKVAIKMGISLCAAIPFLEHNRNNADYKFILNHAAHIHYVSEPGYAAWKYQVRNQWMVNNGTRGLVCWNGSKGGTHNCIKYANGLHRLYDNIWQDCLT